MVKILHLSDLHFCRDAQTNNMKELLIEEAHTVHDLPVGQKLLIITGDFHNFGDTDYALAVEFIDNLVKTMNIDPAQDMFIVPGNHDVGNDTTLAAALGEEYQKCKWNIYAATNLLNYGDLNKDNVERRLLSFAPFCKFARRIGIYCDVGDELLPAKVHVRRWRRNKLNILHLNTALVADGSKAKDNQKADVNTATASETWDDLFDECIPTLALGHNNYYDLEKGQQDQLAHMFARRNVSAYLCGDTHKINLEVNEQLIPLEGIADSGRLQIPNIVCAKGISETGDDYSDFGYYWHEWDEATGRVNVCFHSWRPELRAKTVINGAAAGGYIMRKKSEASDTLTPSPKPPKSDLKQELDKILRHTRDNHPSFVLLKRDGIDKKLFPGMKEFTHVAEGRTDDKGPVSPVWSIIQESWKSGKKRNIVIEGEGGIGKTVALFSVTNIKVGAVPPAVYVSMHMLVDEKGNCIKISDYIKGLSEEHGAEIIRLADGGWSNGPKLLLLLDGFNEVPADKRRTILHMLNHWHGCSGAQLIAVSRPMDGMNLKAELADDPIVITLQPLSREVVRDYLGERTPKDADPLWSVLTYPLFLTLYVKTANLEGKVSDGYALKPKLAVSGGALIWNYLQRELLKVEREDWVIRCAFACEYVLPYIGYIMEREHRFTIKLKQLVKLIKEAVASIDFERLPHHLTNLLNEYECRHFDAPDKSKVDWNNTVFHDIGLLKADKGNYAFIHQHFRDALAGLYLVNQAEMMRNRDTLPEVWRRAANHYVMDYAAELIEKSEAHNLWEINRKNHPTDSSATYTMLELQRRMTDGTDSTLNFSGMDLRRLSLVRYMREREHGEKDLKLFRKPEYSVNTRFAEDTFRSPGHTGQITCVAVLENGLCISGSDDRTLRVWDLHTGECLRIMEGHTKAISCVAMTKGGLCVSGSGDKTLRVWDPHTGECLRIIKGHSKVISCVAVTKEDLCVSGSGDKTLRVWNLHTGECLRIMEGHTKVVSCVAVTEDGLCISGSEDKTLRVWNPRTGKCLSTMEGHTGSVTCAVVAGNGLCVSGSEDKTLRVWDLYTGKCLRIIDGHTGSVTCVVVTMNGLCVSGSNDETLRVWDPHTTECLRTMEKHTGWIRCVTVTEDGLCVSGSVDKTLRVWNLYTGECLRAIEGHTGWVRCVAVTEDGLYISVSDDKTLQVWKPDTGVYHYTMEGNTNTVTCVAVTGDGLCISGSWNNNLRVWDPRNGKYLCTMKGHTDWVRCVAVTGNGLCVSGSDDRTLRIWDLSSGACLRVMEGHTHWVRCVTVTKDGMCISGSEDKTLRMWDSQTGKCLSIMEGHTMPVTCVAVTGDGLCVSGSKDKTLRLWNPSSGECLRIMEGHTDSIRCVAVTEEGLCISGSRDKTLRVWDIHTGKCVRTMKGHTGWVRCVTVLANGLCISGSEDETLRIWDIHTGKCLDVWRSMEIDVSKMDFSKAVLTSALSKSIYHQYAKMYETDQE